MIVSFNPEIFKNKDNQICTTLAKILIALTEKDHFVSLESIESIFFDDEYNYIFAENIIAQDYLSKEDRENLESYIMSNREEISQILTENLTHFTIGTDSGEIHPKDAYRIINKCSLIVVENYPNDWKFITGIIDKYQNFGKRRSIYKLIKKALDDDDEYLSYNHGGGSGIQAQLQGRVEGRNYRNIHKFKLFVIFDSDKTHKEDDLDKGHKSLIQYLKRGSISEQPIDDDISYNDSDFVIWHILYKRAIENYVPVEVIIRNISNLNETQKDNLRSLSAEEMDFIQYYKPENKPKNYYISIGKDKVKDQFPEMFLTDFLPRELEDRCSHHKVSITLPNGTIEQVSEIEQILLKIAKII